MKTIRRIYFYAVAFISMEVVLWGMIGLIRAIFSDSSNGGVSQLSQALALIFVGVPVFWLHWWWAQRSAEKDEEERASTARAFFLYALLLGLLIPLTQNGLAVINRLLADLFNIAVSRVTFGRYQSLSDNLIAALMNGFVAAYFLNILKKDWQDIANTKNIALTRRVYRYIWVFYALIMSIVGVNQILRYIFSYPQEFGGDYYQDLFVNGLALVFVGIPLWVWVWKIAQDALSDVAEKKSLLRLGILYFFSLAGVLFVLSSTGMAIYEALKMLFENNLNFNAFIEATDEFLAIAIPFGAVWAYYGHWLKRDITDSSNAPRRAALNRIYYYILSLIGLATTFSGVSMLLSFVIDAAFFTNSVRLSRISDSLATLLIGFPLWIKTWRPMQAEALTLDEAGQHARRSIIRKIYLYIAVFAGVVGGMIVSIQLITLILESILDTPSSHFASKLLDILQLLILFGGLLAYHWQSLRRDGLLRSEIKQEKEDLFTAILLDKEEGTLLNQLAPLVDAEDSAINIISQNPAEDFADAKALILPLDLMLDPPAGLTQQLSQFNGSKLLLTRETDGWFIMESLAQIKKSLNQLEEGEEIQKSPKIPGWMFIIYILAGMMAVEILFFLLIIVFDGF